MNFLKLYFTISLLIAISSNEYAQAPSGLWEVSSVTVGEQIMTPVAKWTRFKPNGTFESGNGWLQNIIGSWIYDQKNSTLEMNNENGIKDEYGPFSIHYKDGNMYWNREEDGMQVTVSMKPIDELPASPADLIHGLWDLESYSKADLDITQSFDPENQYYLFMRWDRILVTRSPQGKRSYDYWHINAHKPEITFLDNQNSAQPKIFNLEVDENSLKLTSLPEQKPSEVWIFKKLHEFPSN